METLKLILKIVLYAVSIVFIAIALNGVQHLIKDKIKQKKNRKTWKQKNF